jgi:hypothetical protein
VLSETPLQIDRPADIGSPTGFCAGAKDVSKTRFARLFNPDRLGHRASIISLYANAPLPFIGRQALARTYPFGHLLKFLRDALSRGIPFVGTDLFLFPLLTFDKKLKQKPDLRRRSATRHL